MQLTHVIATSIGIAFLLALVAVIRSHRLRHRRKRWREIDDLRGRDT